MNQNSFRNALLISILSIVILITIVMVLSIGEGSGLKNTLTLICVFGIIIFLILLWMRTFQDMKREKPQSGENITHIEEAVEEEPFTRTEAIIQHTGSTCETAGTYQCTEHPERTLSMEVDKRFPPCRGGEKFHSADWIRTED